MLRVKPTAAALIFLALAMAGCATYDEGGLRRSGAQPVTESSTESQSASPNTVYVKEVPFFPQTQYQCGPASLAAVLNYWGSRVSPDEITKEIYRADLKGTLSLDLFLYAKDRHFDASMRQGSWELLEAQLKRNRPVIAFLNLGFRQVPIGHFVVVVGLDPDQKTVIAYSGTTKDEPIPYDRFRAAWEKTNYWSLLIQPPSSQDGAQM
jgi:ABC-type bacteriocin/lantibiotic exporter with double-glycine peptidase domain